MLSKTFSSVPDSWSYCPSTTNAVERRNRECKSDRTQQLKIAITNVYKLDKMICHKHMAAEQGTSILYRSRDFESRKKSAAARQRQRMAAINPDLSAQHGPPDRTSNFVSDVQSLKRPSTSSSSQISTTSKKLALAVDSSIVAYIPNPHPEVMGRQVKVKFQIGDSDNEEWFEGVIFTYNGMTGDYGVFFPCDGQTVDISLDSADLKLI